MFQVRVRVVLLLMIFLPCLAAQEGAASSSPAWVEVEDKTSVPVLTPSLADRRFARIRLNNRLEALLISDPSADKSAASLSVQVGSWSEPAETPGLAHFLEHLLFLGTAAYPGEGDYLRFITQHGGSTNAFTASDRTCFLFSINHDAFPEALDRFSHFFKDPLFSPSGVDRELHAIDQEYFKDLNLDGFRELYVLKEQADPHHPFHSFDIGNLEALKKVSREKVLKFYEEHYSANLMHVVVYSSLPLETLKKLVVDCFSPIKDKDKEALHVTTTALPASAQGRLLYVQSVENQPTLQLYWEMPSHFSHQLLTKPEQLVAFVLGHEGDQSLLAQLKREGLATAIAAGGYEVGTDTLLFSLRISLTDKGLKQKETTLERVFQTLALLRDEGFPPYLFDEIHRMALINYQYQSRQEAFKMIENLADEIVDEGLSTFPEQTHLISRFDPDLAAAFVKELTPQRCLYVVSAPELPSELGPFLQERWLKVPYAVQPLELLQQWQNATPLTSIGLPTANPYLPRDLTLVPSASEQGTPKSLLPHPQLGVDIEGRGQLFFASDTRYHVPEVNFSFRLKAKSKEKSPAIQQALIDLHLKAVKDSLSTDCYQALLAGLAFTLENKDGDVELEVKGYSDHSLALLEKIFEKLAHQQPSEERFALYKEDLARDYDKAMKEGPLNRGRELLKGCVHEEFILSDAKAKALQEITYEKLLSFSATPFDSTYLQAVLYGNLERQTASQVWQSYEKFFPGQPYPKREQPVKKVLWPSEEGGPYYLEASCEQRGNAVLLAIHNGAYSFKARAAQQLLEKSLEEPFYSTLRTQQQTAYIVVNTSQDIERQLYSVFAVQSATHNSRDLLARFELFLEGYLQEMDKNPALKDQFETLRAALVTWLTQPPENLHEMASRLRLLAFDYEADFDWIDKRVQAFRDLTLDEFLAYSREFIGRVNRRRLAVLMNGVVAPQCAFNYTRVADLPALRLDGRYLSKEELTR